MKIIAGTLKNRNLTTPKGLETRPTSSKVRGALFNICQNYIEGTRFLDVFAGSGAMGIEALSRGAAKAVFIDKSPVSCHCIQANLKSLELEKEGLVICRDALSALKFLQTKKEQFDLVYIDPPYREFHVEHLLEPFTEELLADGGTLFLEESARDVPESHFADFELVSVREYGKTALYQLRKREST